MSDRVRRLREIANAIARGDRSELTMRVPAEPNRDADLVISWAADELDRLTRELAEAKDNWWKHPKAQLEIAGKARMSLRLQRIESIVNGMLRDEIGIDDDYWCDLCDKALTMRDELAEAREWIALARHLDSCEAQGWEHPIPCTCGRDALLAALEVPCS